MNKNILLIIAVLIGSSALAQTVKKPFKPTDFIISLRWMIRSFRPMVSGSLIVWLRLTRLKIKGYHISGCRVMMVSSLSSLLLMMNLRQHQNGARMVNIYRFYLKRILRTVVRFG